MVREVVAKDADENHTRDRDNANNFNGVHGPQIVIRHLSRPSVLFSLHTYTLAKTVQKC